MVQIARGESVMVTALCEMGVQVLIMIVNIMFRSDYYYIIIGGRVCV